MVTLTDEEFRRLSDGLESIMPNVMLSSKDDVLSVCAFAVNLQQDIYIFLGKTHAQSYANPRTRLISSNVSEGDKVYRLLMQALETLFRSVGAMRRVTSTKDYALADNHYVNQMDENLYFTKLTRATPLSRLRREFNQFHPIRPLVYEEYKPFEALEMFCPQQDVPSNLYSRIDW